MSSPDESGRDASGDDPPHLIIFDPEPLRSADLAATLATHGYRVTRSGSAEDVFEAPRHVPAALVVWANGPPAAGSARAQFAALRTESRGRDVPLIGVFDDDRDAPALAGPLDDADDWVARGRASAELPWRVARLLGRRKPAGAMAEAPYAMPVSPRFIPLIVHDMRTPLNVIGLSLRMIEQSLPRKNPDLEEDLRFVEENFKQIEWMLAQLSDYYRLFEERSLAVSEFSPKRLLDQIVEERTARGSGKVVPIHLDVQETCPAEAALDEARAKLALQYALTNATAAANGSDVGVRLTVRGGPDRWVTEVRLDRPPPPSVKPVELRPDRFERLCGIAAERRGMDLAIAARISELFGGAARLDVRKDRGTTIVLDWPTRLSPS